MSNIKDPLNKLEFPSKRKVLQYWPVVCALIIGFMGTYVLWQWINQTEEKQIKEKFIERAEGISSEFERHLVSYEYTLKMLRAVFLASDYVSEEEYEVLSAGILLNRPDIKGVHFIPKVREQNSPQLSSSPYWYVEDAVKKEGGVKEGQAPLVVQRSVSLDYFESLVGLNMSHYPEFQESIEQSFVENTVVASLPITLFPDVDDIFLYYPLFQKSKNQNLPDRYKNILAQYNADAGFLSLSIKISDFFKNHKEYKGVNIRLYLSDGDGKRVSLHEDGENVDIWHNDVVEMFSKQWEFEYWPNNIEELRGVRNEFIILLSGIALSLFLAIYIGTSIYRKGKDYQLNQTLNQERTYLDSILNNMMQGVVTINEFGTIITFNKWAEEIFGYGSHEVIAKNVTELMPKKYRERHQAGLDRYLNTGNATILGADLELEGLRKNGDVFPMALSITEVKDDEHSIFIGMIRDISEQREREKQLKEAIFIAEKANQTKSDFLANMSHELRTPLNSIMGLSQLLSEEKTIGKENLEMVSTIQTASDNLLIIVNDILDISKIESGNIVLEEIAFDFNMVLLGVIEVMGPVASKKGITLSYKSNKEDIPYVVGDSFRVNRILTNLIGNAIKYTDVTGEEKTPPSVSVEISVDEIDKKAVQISCNVVDMGIGIPEDKLDVIFQKFSQADASTTRKYGGTGLGLAITQELVEMMGGEIGVESQEGKGSTFWFKIPFKTTEKISKDKSSKRKRKACVPKSEISPKTVKILIAEDNELNQMFIKRALKKLGVDNYDVCDNGNLAIQAFEEKEYDIILMDCHMPEKNGYEATVDIRNSEKSTGMTIPIVALTADAMMGTKEKCLEIGMTEYIAKPIDIDELKRVLSSWINFEQK